MSNLIWSRKLPLEKDELLVKLQEMENKMMEKGFNKLLIT